MVSVEAIPFNPSLEAQRPGVRHDDDRLRHPGLGARRPRRPRRARGSVGLARVRARAARAFAPGSELPAFDTSLAEELPPFEEHPMLEGAPGMAAPIRSAADLTREQMIEYVTTVAQENPDSIAKLVKLWLAE